MLRQDYSLRQTSGSDLRFFFDKVAPALHQDNQYAKSCGRYRLGDGRFYSPRRRTNYRSRRNSRTGVARSRRSRISWTRSIHATETHLSIAECTGSPNVPQVVVMQPEPVEFHALYSRGCTLRRRCGRLFNFCGNALAGSLGWTGDRSR
jgi:hypothetical protein